MSEKFDRKYFDGQGYGSGKGDFFRDFPQHHKTASEILKRKPASVLEVGGARGYICKILQANGVPATCMDISIHCWHTRAVKEFYLHDATVTPWFGNTDLKNDSRLKGGKFDLCFSIAFLEHIPEDKLPNLILEMGRVTKRGLHGITTKIIPNDQDQTHCTIKPLEWWHDLFLQYAGPNYPIELVDKEDLEKEPIPLPLADGLIKLNIGCFADMFYYGWKNIDRIDMREWARFRGYDFTPMDVKAGIQYPDNSADVILASHFLEHLNREEGARFLAECFRVLKPNGLLRLAVPDAKLLAKVYIDGTIMEYRHVNVGVDNAPDDAEAFFQLLLAGHQTIYDFESANTALRKAGFFNVRAMQPFDSSSSEILSQTIPMYPTLSTYLEARKPSVAQTQPESPISENHENHTPTSATHVKKARDMAKDGKDVRKHEQTSKAASTHVEHDFDEVIQPISIPTHSISASTHKDVSSATRVDDKLKVALLSTPLLTVPPLNYGGLELIVASLGKELAKLGHDVTIFAPKGSKVEGCRVVEVGEPAVTVFLDWLKAETDMFDQVKAELMTGGYDIIHGHNWFGMEYRAKALDPRLHVLHTHHGGLVADWWTKTRAPFKLNMVGISNWMKSVYERQGIATRAIYNGVDMGDYPLHTKKGDRFLWMSRIAFFKAPHVAIQIAKQTGIKLDIVGATQFVEDAKYVEQVKQSCDGDQIQFIGEVSNARKVAMLQCAKALLVTGKWGEPFGLHVVEAMMTGTPVIAIADGGIAETVKHGGILCQDIDGLTEAVRRFKPIAPSVCRRNAKMFDTRNMALSYVAAYRDILAGKEW